jgi:outer membrane protein assembly factor BamB
MWRPALGVTFVLGLLISASAGGEAPKEPEENPPFTVDSKAGQVIARGTDGKPRWATSLKGRIGGVRPPHLLWDTKRVYVNQNDGITALDAKTGEVRWQSDGPSDRLLLSGDLLLATDCTSDRYVGKAGRLLTARSTITGGEIFRVNLPIRNFDPNPIEEVAGLFLVQTDEDVFGVGNSLLIDRQGKVRHRLKRQVVAGLRRGEDVVLLTSTDIVCLTSADRVRWAAAVRGHEWIAGGGLVPLGSKEVLAVRYCLISDSGVDVVRLNLATGKTVWQTHCAELGVLHSAYHHEARVVVEGGDNVRVTSEASGGTFIEVLDLRTGKQKSRLLR